MLIVDNILPSRLSICYQDLATRLLLPETSPFIIQQTNEGRRIVRTCFKILEG